jgi:hypothetical protein
MQHVQGYTGNHYTLPSGNYLLCIAPAVARATGKQMAMKNTPSLLAVLMVMTMRRHYVTACIPRWRRSRASLEGTGHRHWASINYDYIKGTYHCRVFVVFFIINTLKMGAKQKDGPQ